jgi:hypothetical protein
MGILLSDNFTVSIGGINVSCSTVQLPTITTKMTEIRDSSFSGGTSQYPTLVNISELKLSKVISSKSIDFGSYYIIANMGSSNMELVEASSMSGITIIVNILQRNKKVAYTYKMYNCLLSVHSLGELNSLNSSLTNDSLTFTVDNVEIINAISKTTSYY